MIISLGNQLDYWQRHPILKLVSNMSYPKFVEDTQVIFRYHFSVNQSKSKKHATCQIAFHPTPQSNGHFGINGSWVGINIFREEERVGWTFSIGGSEHTFKEGNILSEKRKRGSHERGLLVGLSEGRANFLWLSATAVNSEVGPNQATAFREIQKNHREIQKITEESKAVNNFWNNHHKWEDN